MFSEADFWPETAMEMAMELEMFSVVSGPERWKVGELVGSGEVGGAIVLTR